jgi:hypothetical protein
VKANRLTTVCSPEEGSVATYKQALATQNTTPRWELVRERNGGSCVSFAQRRFQEFKSTQEHSPICPRKLTRSYRGSATFFFSHNEQHESIAYQFSGERAKFNGTRKNITGFSVNQEHSWAGRHIGFAASRAAATVGSDVDIEAVADALRIT